MNEPMPADSDVVQAEPMSPQEIIDAGGPADKAVGTHSNDGSREYVFGRRMGAKFVHVVNATGGAGLALKIGMFVCLFIAWALLLSAVPFTSIIALPFVFGAVMLSLLCLFSGSPLLGIFCFLLSTGGSAALYFIGVARFLAWLA